MRNRFIGDRAFYRRVLGVAVPIIIQNGITNFVSLLDNIMVGQVGTVQMGGVSVVNLLLLVYNICLFGATSGAGIFTAQFHGSQNHEGVRHTVRYKLLICLLLSVLGIGIFLLGGTPLINLYLKGEGEPAEAAQILQHGQAYLAVMLWGLVPFALSNVYASTLRECGHTTVPMLGGTIAVIVNLVLNYILIFGHFGAPAMGVRGAALATVISRYVELAIVAGWAHLNPKKVPFVKGLYHSLYIPGKLLGRITVKGMPLLMNEFLWSTGVAILNQCYSVCGLDVVNAVNISSTIANLSNVVTMALGNTVGILMGQMMGAGRPKDEIMGSYAKLGALSVASGVLFGGIMAAIAGAFPLLYKTTDTIRLLSTQLILLTALAKPPQAFMYATYFAMRSGGKTWTTFFYDCGILWLVTVPAAFLLTRFTGIGILWLYFICQMPDMVKCVLGFLVIKKGSWIQNLAVK